MGSGALGPLTDAVEKALLNMKKGEECKLVCRKDSGDYFRLFFEILRLFFHGWEGNSLMGSQRHTINFLHLFWANWAKQR